MRYIRFVVAGAGLLALATGSLAGQSVVTRTPSMNGAWLASAGGMQFNFVHRFRRGGAPEHRISTAWGM